MNIMFQVGSWHYDKGGTDLFVKTISYWLANKGHKVIVLAHRLEEEDCHSEDIKHNKGIIKVRYTPKQKKGLRFNPAVYLYRLLITSRYLSKIAKKEKAEVIVVGEPELLATLPLKLTNTKIVCRGGALMYETMKREIYKEKGPGLSSSIFISLMKIYNNLTLKIPDVMVPVNASEYQFLNKKKSSKAKIQTIPHGIKTNLFKPSGKRKNKKIVVGYVGRLAPIKYPERALSLFNQASKNQKTEFHWVGPLDPSLDKDYFNKLKDKLNIKNAKWVGQIKNTELPDYLNKMDIFLQVEQQTNVSRSTTEAAACGLPVVALNIGKEPYGFFTMSEEKALSELRKLIKDKKYRNKQSKMARKIILENYSEDKTYNSYLELFNSLRRPR